MTIVGRASEWLDTCEYGADTEPLFTLLNKSPVGPSFVKSCCARRSRVGLVDLFSITLATSLY